MSFKGGGCYITALTFQVFPVSLFNVLYPLYLLIAPYTMLRNCRNLVTKRGTYLHLVKGMHESSPISNDFDEDFRRHHIHTNFFQKTLLGIGSAAVSIMDPRRGDMIACMGEATGLKSIEYMLGKMQESEEGLRILAERPRINSRIVDLEKLKTMPENTLGKTYSNFLINNKVTPDSRPAVQFVDDVHLAYVMQRYREVHDLFHTVLQMPTTMLGEVSVKWVEAIQTRLPMCIGGALFGPIRLKSKHRELYAKYYLPWAIHTGYNTTFLMNLYFEMRWEQTLDELYKEINFKTLVVPKM